MTSTYSGQVWPRSCETSTIDFMPEGLSPSQPFQVDVGQSQRPSLSDITGLHSSNDGPTSGGAMIVGPCQVCPSSEERSWISSVSTKPCVSGLVSPSSARQRSARTPKAISSPSGMRLMRTFAEVGRSVRSLKTAPTIGRSGQLGVQIGGLEATANREGRQHLAARQQHQRREAGLAAVQMRLGVAVDQAGLDHSWFLFRAV